jgi:hypothetical protein
MLVDLTGATGSMALSSWDDSVTYLTLTSGATIGQSGLFFGGNQSDPTDAIIDIVISATDTAAINWKYARYNLVLTTTTFATQRLMYGQFAVVGFLP